jgi:putative transposase
VSTRRSWLERDATSVPVSRQCVLAGVSRSWVYAQRAAGGVVDEEELLLLRLIDVQYTRRPFCGGWSCIWANKAIPSTASGCSG